MPGNCSHFLKAFTVTTWNAVHMPQVNRREFLSRKPRQWRQSVSAVGKGLPCLRRNSILKIKNNNLILWIADLAADQRGLPLLGRNMPTFVEQPPQICEHPFGCLHSRQRLKSQKDINNCPKLSKYPKTFILPVGVFVESGKY